MALIPFPTISCFAEGFRIETPFSLGGRSPLGNEPVVASPAGRWVGKMSFNVRKPADYADADGFLAALDGSANTFMVGPRDWRGRPWVTDKLTGGLITPDKIAANRAADPAYDTNSDTRGDISFVLNANAQMNAVTLSIRRVRGGLLKRGQYFSVGGRLYIVSSVNSLDDGQVGAVVTVGVRPWLRAAYAAGTALDFAAPVGEMRLTNGSAAMVERNVTPLSTLSLEIVEARLEG